MVEFVSCSYLGLETHPALKKAVVDAIERFGVQVSVARTRVKVDLFPQLEARLNDIMHGAHTLTFNAVTPTYAFGGPPSLPGIAACVAAADLHLDGTVTARQEKLQNVIRYL
ncbi:hypothetical protein [Enterobacter cloacae]|nr:hypothetical protein [Enterobacter cloacae]